MTPHEFTDTALPILRERFERMSVGCTQAQINWLRHSFDTLEYAQLWGQPSHERTCYEKDGKHYLRTYNSHVKMGDEHYDAYNLWELDGDNLKHLGGLHR